MAVATLDSERSPAPSLVAPRWHLALFVGLLLLGPALSLLSPGSASRADGRSAAYLALVGGQAMLLFVLWLGLRLAGTSLKELAGDRWRGRDVALAAAGWGAITLVETLAPGHAASALLPETLAEKLSWIPVACFVAFTEELVFRGYLQRQFEALSRNAALAIVLQAVLFGLVHANQGPSAAGRAGLYGLGFGILARLRGSLRPGMLAHAWVDVASGLFRL